VRPSDRSSLSRRIGRCSSWGCVLVDGYHFDNARLCKVPVCGCVLDHVGDRVDGNSALVDQGRVRESPMAAVSGRLEDRVELVPGR